MTSNQPDIEGATVHLRERLGFDPRAVLVLGSGLGGVVEEIEDAVTVGFDALPGFPPSGVAGHAGRWVGGRLAGVTVLVQAGRYHVYEGHAMEVVTAPMRVAARLGVGFAVLTNAAGGADPALEPGQLVLLDDHINLMFRSPLAGPLRPGEERFPDMSRPYDPGLQARALDAARSVRVPLVRGTYAAVTGPSYETAAEVRMLRRMGADVIGMSTVPEVIAARAAGVACLGFSMVTNKGTGYTHGALGHDEVVEVGRRAGKDLAAVLRALFAELGSAQFTGAK